MTRWLNLLLMAGLAVGATSWAAQDIQKQSAPRPIAEELRTGGPYVPTPSDIVLQMLDFAKVGPRDYVVDLGSGDGVIVLTAAHRYKASGEGIEIDPELVRLSNERAQNLGIGNRVSFAAKDIFKADVSGATVVTLYLLPDMMRALLPKLFRELRPGTRIVSHDYHFDAWQHDETITFHAPEKESITGIPEATLYRWVVPARVDGRWDVTTEGLSAAELRLRQHYNGFEGESLMRNAESLLTRTQLNGDEVLFTKQISGTEWRFRGRVSGDVIEGTAESSGRRIARWRAVRRG
jgi:phospholipid N-methyltransferase